MGHSRRSELVVEKSDRAREKSRRCKEVYRCSRCSPIEGRASHKRAYVRFQAPNLPARTSAKGTLLTCRPSWVKTRMMGCFIFAALLTALLYQRNSADTCLSASVNILETNDVILPQIGT